MGPFTVNSCCCLDLRVGALVIGYVDLICQLPLLYFINHSHFMDDFGLFFGRKFLIAELNEIIQVIIEIFWWKVLNSSASISWLYGIHTVSKTAVFIHIQSSTLFNVTFLSISDETDSIVTKASSDDDWCILSPSVWKCTDSNDFISV